MTSLSCLGALLLVGAEVGSPAAAEKALVGHTGAVVRVAFSGDGVRLASAGFDQTVRTWDVASATVGLTLKGHRGGVTALAWSPDGRQLATGALDAEVRLYDASAGQLVAKANAREEVAELAFAPDGRLLVAAGLHGAGALYDVAAGLAQLAPLDAHSVDFLPDGKSLVVGLVGGGVEVVGVKDRSHAKVMKTGPRPFVRAAGPGSFVCYTRAEPVVRLATLPRGRSQELQRHQGPITALGGSFAGQWASASEDGLVLVWNLGRKKEVFRRAFSRPTAVAVSPDGRWLAVAEGALIRLVKLGEETARDGG